jgi:hypothetical protein
MKKQLLATWIFASSFVVLSLLSSVASAQYNYYTSSSFLFNQYHYPNLVRDMSDEPSSSRKSSANTSSTKTQQQRPSAANNSSSSTANRSTGRASANNNPLPYTRDQALSVKLREAFLQDFAKQMPDAAADMRETAEKTDLVQIMAGFVQLQGLDSGSMEGLMALWYGQAWAVAHQKPMPTPQQYQGIAEQLRNSIAKSAEWSKLSNVQRQTLFEQLAYPLFIQKANYQAYLKQGKTDSMARMASATQLGMQKVGLDLQKVRLSDSGFVKP